MDSVQPPEPVQPKHRNKILQFISEHPLGVLIGFLGAIASIIALPFTIWPLTPKRILSYKLSSTRAAIVQASEQSDISVNYRGMAVKGDLTAVQVAIWNDGAEPIKHDDILKPVVVHATNNCRILEATLNKAYKPREETDFKLDLSRITNGVLGVDWRILEKRDLAVVQILYEGKPDLPFVLEGTVVGQRIPQLGSPPIKSSVSTINLVLVIISVASALIGTPVLLLLRSLEKRKRPSLLIAAIFIVCVAGFVLSLVNLQPAPSPF